MSRTFAVLCLFTLAVLLQAFIPATADAASYIGAAKCKMCHNKDEKGAQYKQWSGTKHAKAMETLKSEAAKKIAPDAEKNPKCLECHKVGVDEGVGCEACHGAGSEYKGMETMKSREKSLAAGMIMPTEAVCKKCHNEKSPTFKSFDFKTEVKKISHPNPAK